jgi:hypothetical protein
LAENYGVSRWYMIQILVSLILALGEAKSLVRKPLKRELFMDKRHLDRAIINLRIVGNVPLEGIQCCLEEALEIYFLNKIPLILKGLFILTYLLRHLALS